MASQYTPADIDLLHAIRTDILNRPSDYRAGDNFLREQYGPERLHRHALADWERLKDHPVQQASNRASGEAAPPKPEQWTPAARACQAVNGLRDAMKGEHYDAKAEAVLLLAVMVWDADADKRHSIFTAFGPWGTTPAGQIESIGRWVATSCLDKQSDLRRWMHTVRMAWQALPKPAAVAPNVENLLDRVDPQAVIQSIMELREWAGELQEVARTLSEFAFKWAERNGGVPTTKAAIDKLQADYRARFAPQPDVPDEQAMPAIEAHYQAWAKERGILTTSQADLERFDDETGVITHRIHELSGFSGPHALAHRIGARCNELARAAVALGCDDATVAALNGVAALMPDIVDGRADLSHPPTWTEARRQANGIFQSESIAGIPLHRAWEVALDRLEVAAAKDMESASPTDTEVVGSSGDAAPKAMTWLEAKQFAEKHCARNPFPGVNALARIIREQTGRTCSQSTMSRAVKESANLRVKAAGAENRESVSAGTIAEGVTAFTEQTGEAAPIDQAIIAELQAKSKQIEEDPLLRRLIQDATPDERRAYLEDTPLHKLEELARLAYHDPDASPPTESRSR